MFDIGFFELLVVAIVGLIVIGPERLPETIRTVGLWIGRMKRALRDSRAELEQHLGADDIRRQLHNEEVMRGLNATREEIDRVLNEKITLEPEPVAHPQKKKEKDQAPAPPSATPPADQP